MINYSREISEQGKRPNWFKIYECLFKCLFRMIKLKQFKTEAQYFDEVVDQEVVLIPKHIDLLYVG